MLTTALTSALSPGKPKYGVPDTSSESCYASTIRTVAAEAA